MYRTLHPPRGGDRQRPDRPQRDAVLATVKAWPTDAEARRRPFAATASPDGVCARRHPKTAGRDEETALGSNKETDQKDKCRGRRDTIRPQGVHCFRPCRKNPTQKRTIDVLPKPDNLKSYRHFLASFRLISLRMAGIWQFYSFG